MVEKSGRLIGSALMEKGEKMQKCEHCRFFTRRELTPYEVQYLRYNHDKMIDTRICGLGGCDGSQYEERREDEVN